MSHKPGIDIEVLANTKFKYINEKNHTNTQLVVKHYIPWEMMIKIVSFLEEIEYYNLIVVSKYFANSIIPFFMKDWIWIDNNTWGSSPQYFKMKIDIKMLKLLTNWDLSKKFEEFFGIERKEIYISFKYRACSDYTTNPRTYTC